MYLNVEVSSKALENIQRIQGLTGLVNYADVFNNALAFLEWATEQRRRGRTVVAVDKKTWKFDELQMDALDRVLRDEFSGKGSIKTLHAVADLPLAVAGGRR